MPFERSPHAARRTQYPILKRLRAGWTVIFSFSAFPLSISIAPGCFLSLAGLAYLARVIYPALVATSLVSGWASVIALQCVFSEMILLALGGIADYLARTYEETKNRPLYVVAETSNIRLPQNSIPRAVILEQVAAPMPVPEDSKPRPMTDEVPAYRSLSSRGA